MLDKQPHTATAVAKSRTRLLRIERAALPEVLRINADVATALLGKFAARIAHLESCLVDAAHTQVPAPPSKPAAPVAPRPVEAPPPAPVAPAPAPPPPPAPPKPVAAPAPAPPSAPPKPAAPVTLALRVTAANQVVALDATRTQFLIGRPDPATGTTPEVDLGPFDVQRTLSRRHAMLLRDGVQYSIREDAATTNGTYLNGERLQTGIAMPVKAGDKLRFGSIEVELIGT